MKTVSSKQQALGDSGDVNSAHDSDSTAVAQALEAAWLMPFHVLAAGRNQSVRSLLAEMTGLSKARIARGRLDLLRATTEERVRGNLRAWLEKEIGSAEASSIVNAWKENAPRTRSGMSALWTTWIQSFEFAPVLVLPRTKAVALQIDDLINRLICACRTNDLSAFKQVWRDHLELHGTAIRVGTDPVAIPATATDLQICDAVESWRGAQDVSLHGIDGLYMDLMATFDAEWGTVYFGGRQRSPLFPLVMLRLQDGLLETGRATSRRNLFHRPARRLLELMYSLSFRSRYRRWPAKAPGPQAIALALDDASEDTEVSATLVSNHFDGTRKLTMDLAYDYWWRLQRRFHPAANPSQQLAPPLPVMVLALHWDELLIRDRGQSFFIFDQKEYASLWTLRNRQCQTSRNESVESLAKNGHQEESLDWPSWLTGQSSADSV